MTHGSLFSGIGGFDLAAEWMGWENIFHCEWNAFGQKVLKYYFPQSISYNDITKTDFTIHRGKIDVLTGGFPCQPYSLAGKRKGKEDERHLWPSMCRAIKEIQPRWIVGENVHGIINWSGGLVFEEVQTDLEAQGYEVQSYVLPAAGVQNAPHRRDRVWFVAHSNSNGQHKRNGEHEEQSSEGREYAQCDIGKISDAKSIIEHTLCERQERRMHKDESEVTIRKQFSKRDAWRIKSKTWENYPTKSPICNGDDGISYGLDSITFSKWRSESIKAGGNAVVPQVVYQIFKTIQDYENLNT
jgi:DNA (cytosine-5)-methyltransferase 1